MVSVLPMPLFTSCLEGVFSETHIQPSENLYTKIGAKRLFAPLPRSYRNTTSCGYAYLYRVGPVCKGSVRRSALLVNPQKERLTVAEAAKLLNVTPEAIRQRIRRGTIEHEQTEEGRYYVYTTPIEASQDVGDNL